jgi:hypothetical protein
MFQVEIDITITLKAPFITRSSSPGPYGIDAVNARNSDGRLCIPGTHIVGKLREAWEELGSSLQDEADADIVPSGDTLNLLLGEQLSDGDFSPRAKQLYFSDFVCREAASDGSRNRIQIEDDRKAARKGSLLNIECPFPSGRTVSFHGVLSFESHDAEHAKCVHRKVKCGLQWISQIGGYRSVGFGQVTDIHVSKPKMLKLGGSTRQWRDAEGLDIIIEPSAPFCIAGRPAAGNIFESIEDIPGGVIRGSLARKINHLLKRPSGSEIKTEQGQTKLVNLCSNFHRIRITHGFPSARCFVRPVRPPLSLVKAGGLYDVALMKNPCLINNRSPEFQVDWKDDSDAKTLFGWPRLKRELRVRTAIDSVRLRSADNQLFAYEMIVPDERCWLARVRLDKSIDSNVRDAVVNELAMLLENGLLGIGKNKTPAKISVNPSGTITDEHDICAVDKFLCEDSLLAISLQTPALLVSPRCLMESVSKQDLFKGYQMAWAEICPALTMVRFFARQSLSGGLYQYGRFRKKSDAPYQPWVLTDAGSVFLFTASDQNEAKNKVISWLKYGLEVPGSTLRAYDLTLSDDLWKYCPFIPQNGFGEIAVNLKIHSGGKPKPGQYDNITVISVVEA